MEEKRDNRNFWNRYAKLYDFEINMFSGKAYKAMYRMMAETLSRSMNVLEIATGTGLIALNIAGCARQITAVDFAPKMIEKAKKKKNPGNVCFSVEDAASLSFVDASFDAVIISNALHIMPDPIMVLHNISKVLKPNGILIAPSYSHGHIRESTWNLNAKLIRRLGLETYSKWSPDEYVGFIKQNGFRIEKWRVLQAAFPLVYLEAKKTD